MFHFVFLEKKCFLLAAGDIHLNFCRKGDGINLGFEGSKGKKAVECGGQECGLRIQMRPCTSPAVHLTGSLTLSKLLNLFKSQASHL